MAEMSVASQTAITRMIAAAPDGALQKLSLALRSSPGARSEWIRREVLAQIAQRRMRALVFGPLTPMFRPRADGVRSRVFPAPALAGLWDALRARHPLLVDQAQAASAGGAPTDWRVLDQLCLRAADLLREDPAAAWPGLDAGTAREMAACFDLVPLTRPALARLKAWTERPDAESLAALKLLVRDAVRVAEDAAPRVVEILFAGLDDAPLVLRVVAGVAGAGAEDRFLAESELADFGERIFERLEAAAVVLDDFHPARASVDEAGAVAAETARSAELMRQMELSVDFTPESTWGRRFQALKLRMGKALSQGMSQCERAVDKALPMERVRIVGAMTRAAPRLDAPAEGLQIDEARAAMTVLAQTKAASTVFGCGGRHGQVREALVNRLIQYGDEMIEALNAGAGPAADERRMAALVELCAVFLAQADAEPAARVLRRRLAAAGPAPRVA